MFFDELLVTLSRVDADTKKFRPRLNFTPSIPKIARLPRASRRIILRIKVKNQRRSLEIVQFYRLSGSINATDRSCVKGRGMITNFQLHIHRNEWRKLSRLRALRNPLHRAFTGDFAGRVAALKQIPACWRVPIDHLSGAEHAWDPFKHKMIVELAPVDAPG
jgi:hypothetical protein